jgi:carboxylesterase
VKGCLLIHGFTGSVYEIYPLVEHLKKETDWMIYTPILAGHGEEESLKEASWRDWIASAEVELQKMEEQCDEIYVIGFSMGGLIASYLASKYSITKLVLLSPAVYCINPQLLIRDISDMVRDFFKDQPSASNSITRYKHKIKNTPLKAVYNFRRLVKGLRPSIAKIKVPVLIIQGVKDNLVQPRGAQYIFDHVQSKEKEILYLKESKHMICLDCESDQILSKVDLFLKAQSYTH